MGGVPAAGTAQQRRQMKGASRAPKHVAIRHDGPAGRTSRGAVCPKRAHPAGRPSSGAEAPQQVCEPQERAGEQRMGEGGPPCCSLLPSP